MGESCDAKVDPVSFDDNGRITFVVEVDDCDDSSGRFIFRYRMRDQYGETREYDRSSFWPRTFGHSKTYVDEDLRLSDDETLLSVDVNSGSVDCYCYLEDSDSTQVSMNVLMAPMLSGVYDPGTIETVENLFSKTSAYRQYNYRIIKVNTVKFLWGEAKLDTDELKTIPNKYEERIIRVVNCDEKNNKEYSRRIIVKTDRSVSYEKTKTIVTSNESKVGITLSAVDIGKVNADLIRKSAMTFQDKVTHKFREEITIEHDEKFTIPPLTEYIYKYTAVKGLVIVPIHGRLLIDAHFLMKRKDAPLKGNFWLSDQKLLPDQNDRYVEFHGNLISEGYERLDIKHIPRPISPDDPKCSMASEFGDEDGAILETLSTFVGNG